MESPRKTVGRRIKRARQAAGYRSQRAFAEAIGVAEASVARAETGDERIGDTVFGAIELGLGWPEDCIARYLETGDESVLPGRRGAAHDPRDRQAQIADEILRVREQLRAIRDTHGEDAYRRAVAAELIGDDDPQQQSGGRRSG